MHTRSQTRNLHNQQHQAPPPVVEQFNLEEPFENPPPPPPPMDDQRTMAQLLEAPTEGYEDAIVVPEINANFEYGYIKNHKKTIKNGQTRTQETEEYKRAKDSKPKPGKGETSLKYSHWLLPTRRTHMDSEENTRGSGICSKLSAKEAQCVTITDCQAGNPCELRYDPTAHRWHPKIEY
ncbi:hypothetical protein Tco_0535032 [Tanacetum coccineum]